MKQEKNYTQATTSNGVSSIRSSIFVRLCAMKLTPFHMKHALKFDLEVVSKYAKGDVTVQCFLCVHKGHDSVEVNNSSSRKRKATSTIKIFNENVCSLQLSLSFEATR
jgi:hypothetical protein